MEQQSSYSVVQQMLQACQHSQVKSSEAYDVQGGADMASRPRCNPTEDVSALEKAIAAKDEGTIIDILTKRTNQQRQEIKVLYQKQSGKPLEEVLKKVLSGKSEDIILAMLRTPEEFDAHELKAATKGLGTDEDTLIEICVTKTNQQMKKIKEAYKKEFKTDLAKDITGDTSGEFQKALLTIIKGERSEDCYVNQDLVDKDAKALYEAGEKAKKADVSVFTDIFTHRSNPHLNAVFAKYATYSKHDLNKTLDLQFKGDIECCLVAIVKSAVNKPGYFAEKLNHAMKQGAGASHKVLTRVMVSRAEVDMKAIKDQYKEISKKTLRNAIMDATDGNYETVLLALAGHD